MGARSLRILRYMLQHSTSGSKGDIRSLPSVWSSQRGSISLMYDEKSGTASILIERRPRRAGAILEALRVTTAVSSGASENPSEEGQHDDGEDARPPVVPRTHALSVYSVCGNECLLN